jgi:hypothetical protein
MQSARRKPAAGTLQVPGVAWDHSLERKDFARAHDQHGPTPVSPLASQVVGFCQERLKTCYVMRLARIVF